VTYRVLLVILLHEGNLGYGDQVRGCGGGYDGARLAIADELSPAAEAGVAVVALDPVALEEVDSVDARARGLALEPGHALPVGGVPVDLALGAGLGQAALDAGVLLAEVQRVLAGRQVVAGFARAGRHAGRVRRTRLVALHRAELLAAPLSATKSLGYLTLSLSR
jgi:hypothetical protein